MDGTLMFLLLLTIDKVLNEEKEEDLRKRSLQATLTTQLWAKKGVDRGSIMSYKAICDNCSGNGHINIVDTAGNTQVKQCWICESQGEIKYEEDFINKLINNHSYRLQ